MGQPLVSILFPVYNSTLRGEGRNLLPRAIESLLAQSYPNTELILLDNQSTDATAEICKSYAAQDSRVRYVLDSQQRKVDEAFSHMTTLMNGAYCFSANDDDVFHPQYTEKLLGFLESNPQVDMVYPECCYVDPDNKLVSTMVAANSQIYCSAWGMLANFCIYLQVRNPIPWCFGLYRAAAFKAVQNQVAFDEWPANADNLMILRFFAQGLKCDFYPEVLFLYRSKHRPLKNHEEERKGFPDDFPDFGEPLHVWLYFVRHQLRFKLAVEKELEEQRGFKAVEDSFIYALLVETFIHFSINLFRWIKSDEVKQEDALNQSHIKELTGLIERCRLENFPPYPMLALEQYKLININPAYVKLRLEVAELALREFCYVVSQCMSLSKKQISVSIELDEMLRSETEKIAALMRGEKPVVLPTKLPMPSAPFFMAQARDLLQE